MSSIQTAIQLNDQFTGVIYGIINSVNLAISGFEDMQSTMNANIDISSLEGARDEINRATMTMNEFNASLDSSHPAPVEIPVTWNTDNMADVFTSTGIDRFKQEIESTNSMLERLNTTQDVIARQAFNTNVLPPQAAQDLNSLAGRIDLVRERIEQISANPMNVGTDEANSGLEELRSQLATALEAQEDLNRAIENMDVQRANDAYIQLSQTVGNIERYIRDNVDEQGRFNDAIEEGNAQADNLIRTIKGAVAAYVSIQSIGKALDISDELVSTTARLDQMNDGLQTTAELTNMVYAAAQDARGSFSEMASVVARFGNNARDAFSSSEEVVAFSDLIQKQMTIAGASTQEASNAMLQLSQALGSGVLRGDELNSIFEQAPNLIQSIADYLDVPIGQIRAMASEGELTADIVKAAIFASADDINAKFEQMPMTWGQIWQSMQNTALVAFQPVLQRLNDIANSEAFQNFVNGAIQAMTVLAGVLLDIFDLTGQVCQFIADNWSIIEPIIWGIVGAFGVYYGAQLLANGVDLIGKGIHIAMAFAQMAHAAMTGTLTAATSAEIAAQNGLNAAMYACPIVWIIMLIIALIAVIFAVCSAIAKLTGVASSGFGVLCGVVNVSNQLFKNLLLTAVDVAIGVQNATEILAANIKAVFHNAISNVQAWWYDLLSTCITVIAGICAELNKLPFVEFDYSGITNAANEYAAKSAEAAGNKEEYQSISDAFKEGFNTFDTFQDGWLSDAFETGVARGDALAEKISNFSLSDLFKTPDIPDVRDYAAGFGDALTESGMGDTLDSIAGNTGSIKDALDITEEDLKYMRDLAEQEAVNRYTVAEISVDMSGMQNNISSDNDIDGFMTKLTDAVNEAVDSMTEGVHE